MPMHPTTDNAPRTNTPQSVLLFWQQMFVSEANNTRWVNKHICGAIKSLSQPGSFFFFRNKFGFSEFIFHHQRRKKSEKLIGFAAWLRGMTRRLFSSWYIDWLIDWLIDMSIDWLINWFVDMLIDWLIGWLIDMSIDWLIDWLIDLIAHKIQKSRGK